MFSNHYTTKMAKLHSSAGKVSILPLLFKDRQHDKLLLSCLVNSHHELLSVQFYLATNNSISLWGLSVAYHATNESAEG